MGYATLKTLHLLSIIVWQGGLFFALFCLRHALHPLPQAQRLAVSTAILKRVLQAAFWSAALALLSGAGLFFSAVRSTRQTGMPFNVPLEWLVMAVLGTGMAVAMAWLRCLLLPQLLRAEVRHELRQADALSRAIFMGMALQLAAGATTLLVVMAGLAS